MSGAVRIYSRAVDGPSDELTSFSFCFSPQSVVDVGFKPLVEWRRRPARGQAGVMSNSIQKQFGLSDLVDKLLYVAPEIKQYF